MSQSIEDHEIGGSDEPDRLIEPGPGYRAGLRGLARSLDISTIGAGVVAAVFGCTGPALIVVNGATDAGLTTAQTVSWVSTVYLVGGFISLIMALYYKQPIVGAWSIPAAALVVSSLADHSLAEMVGAYFTASVLVLLLGLSGFVRTLVRWLPMPILMAMIGGVLFKYALNIVGAAETRPFLVGAAVVGFLLLSRFVKAVPGVIGALAFGIVAAVLTDSFESAQVGTDFALPTWIGVDFDPLTMLGVGIPLALVIQAENIQSMGVLIAEKYRPPVNNITVVSGAASLLVSGFGGHNASIAGPMTAICGSDQAGSHHNRRYAAAVVNGIIFVTFGIFASIAVGLVSALPGELVSTVAGLAMFGVLIIAFRGAFSEGRYKLGALVALVVAMGDVTIFGISSPFWALLAGLGVSLLLEFDDFRTRAHT
ncbi:benzoate/H(+) symporter BenE family transporter [Saccharomonospora saliphila]|uniref:benzoate/H(+) symporter BenE family transporter n=1 Tax=Saccharomonospora saliphila TaxID=369829 RepID=UPI0003780891|nr:benzoate/H(+) symporter BenE family transporter [Saccharomonospora saliphila]